MMGKKVFLILFLSLLCHVTGQEETLNEDVQDYENLEAAPGTTTITEVATVSPCKLSVTWSCDGCEEFVENYIVYWESENSEPANYTAENTETTYTIDQLVANTTYDIYIETIFGNTTTFETEAEQGTTDIGAPNDVTGFTIVDTTDSRIYLSWDNTTNECPIVGFSIFWLGQALWDESQSGGGHRTTNGKSETTYIISSLIPYATYEIAIQEVASDYTRGTPSTEEAQTDERISSVPRSVIADTLSSSSINVSWKEPSSANGILTGYSVSWIYQDSDYSNSTTTSLDELNIVLIDLLPCETYDINVAAINGAGIGNNATTTNETEETTPIAPGNLVCNLTETDAGSEYIQVEWDFIETDCTIDHYGVTRREEILWNGQITIYEEESVPSDNNTYPFEPSNPYSLYTVTVRAYTAGNVAGNTSSCETQSGEIAPGAPADLDIVDGTLTDTGFTVVWNDPIDKNGALTKFTVTLYNDTGAFEENIVTEDNVDYSDFADAFYTYTFDELDSELNYTVEVYAENGAGAGEPITSDEIILLQEDEMDLIL